MENNLKLAIKIKLIGKKEVEIQFIRMHPKIQNYGMAVFQMDEENDFMLQKSDSECIFTEWVYVMPEEVTAKNPGKCKYKFNSNQERYHTLKRFSKTLMKYSLGRHFKDKNEDDCRILYFNEYWLVY